MQFSEALFSLLDKLPLCFLQINDSNNDSLNSLIIITNMKDFKGDFNFWPISLRENRHDYFDYNEVDLYDKYATNNFLVPINSIYLPTDANSLCYSARFERLFFLRNGYNKTIFSQFFPNSPDNNRITIKGKIKNADRTFEKNKFDSKEFSDFNIIKICSTRKHLFAIVSQKNKIYAIKPKLSSDGLFEKSNYINELDLLRDPGDSLDFEFYDVSDYETLIFFNNKSQKKLYVGRFKSVKKRFVVFNKISIVGKESFEINTFCLASNKQNIRLSVFDSEKNTLVGFNLNAEAIEKRKSIDIQSFDYVEEISNENILHICHYKISTQFIYEEPLIQENIDLVLLHDKNKIIIFDTKSKRHDVLIGSGRINIDSAPNYDSNLNSYSLGYSNCLYTINHNAIVFGSPENEKLFALLSPKSRELMYLSEKDQKVRKPIDYNDS